MDRNGKEAWREEIVKCLDKSGALFLAHYSGMTVEDLTNLRRQLKAANADFQVVKNTIAKKAIEGRGEACVSDLFKGQTGVVYAYGDAAAAAKVVSEVAKKLEKFKILGGYMDAAALTPKNVEHLGSLPSREVLLAKIIGSLVAPHRGILGVMQGVPRAMVSVLNQIKETKSA